jgi:hypothetical protein
MTNQDPVWTPGWTEPEPPPCHICDAPAVLPTIDGPLCEGCHDALADKAQP